MRLSLSNYFLPVSYGQFVDYAETFKAASEIAFGTECGVKVSALTAPKVYTTFYDEAIFEELDAINAANALLSSEDLADVTEDIWEQAGHVNITINPLDEELAPQFAFATAEFKGNRPRQATFYMQPDNGSAGDVRQTMLERYKWKRAGDGFSSNGTRSGAIPASISSLVPSGFRIR